MRAAMILKAGKKLMQQDQTPKKSICREKKYR